MSTWVILWFELSRESRSCKGNKSPARAGHVIWEWRCTRYAGTLLMDHYIGLDGGLMWVGDMGTQTQLPKWRQLVSVEIAHVISPRPFTPCQFGQRGRCLSFILCHFALISQEGNMFFVYCVGIDYRDPRKYCLLETAQSSGVTGLIHGILSSHQFPPVSTEPSTLQLTPLPRRSWTVCSRLTPRKFTWCLQA